MNPSGLQLNCLTSVWIWLNSYKRVFESSSSKHNINRRQVFYSMNRQWMSYFTIQTSPVYFPIVPTMQHLSKRCCIEFELLWTKIATICFQVWGKSCFLHQLCVMRFFYDRIWNYTAAYSSQKPETFNMAAMKGYDPHQNYIIVESTVPDAHRVVDSFIKWLSTNSKMHYWKGTQTAL